MKRTMLKSKIHRATVTQTDLNYEGSIGIDAALLETADILPYEKVDIYNISTGARFSTYAISAPPLSGEFSLNGAAARLAQPGDLIIITSFTEVEDAACKRHTPKILLLDSKNKVVNN